MRSLGVHGAGHTSTAAQRSGRAEAANQLSTSHHSPNLPTAETSCGVYAGGRQAKRRPCSGGHDQYSHMQSYEEFIAGGNNTMRPGGFLPRNCWWQPGRVWTNRTPAHLPAGSARTIAYINSLPAAFHCLWVCLSTVVAGHSGVASNKQTAVAPKVCRHRVRLSRPAAPLVACRLLAKTRYGWFLQL